jgi:hypothetical protein
MWLYGGLKPNKPNNKYILNKICLCEWMSVFTTMSSYLAVLAITKGNIDQKQILLGHTSHPIKYLVAAETGESG